MLAAYVARFAAEDPLDGLEIGDRPEPAVPDGWVRVRVRAASLNHRDLWSLRGGAAMRTRGGAGVQEADLPRILGSDAAGTTDDGEDVIVHPVIVDPSWDGPELLSTNVSLLSGRYDGTFAEQVVVPRRNLVPKPAGMSFPEAACLPTAGVTAYRMLFDDASLRPGDTVLVQGAGGGLAAALVGIGRAAGLRVWVTGRSERSREFASGCGASGVFETGARLPERVDAVMDSVGPATWRHSLNCLRKGGTMVVPGGTTGYTAEVDIARLFAMNLRIVGTSVGSVDHLRRLVRLYGQTGTRPAIAEVLPLPAVRKGLAALAAGEVLGKVVVEP